MPVPKCNQRAVDKYKKNHYYTLRTYIPKERKETVERYASTNGESLNALVNRLLMEAVGMTAEEWKSTADVTAAPEASDPLADDGT